MSATPPRVQSLVSSGNHHSWKLVLIKITKVFQNPPEKRLTASYLIATSQIHHNSVRLMTQVIEILHGDLEVPTSLSSFPDTNDPRKEVGWYNDIIHRTVVEFGVIELSAVCQKTPRTC
jgi:hypothetical protein